MTFKKVSAKEWKKMLILGVILGVNYYLILIKILCLLLNFASLRAEFAKNAN